MVTGVSIGELCQSRVKPNTPGRPGNAAHIIQQVTTRSEIQDTSDQPFLRQRIGEFFIVLRCLRCPFVFESKARLAAV